MSRKNSPSYDQESKKFLQEYEAAKKENRTIYMDGDQIARIAEQYTFDDKIKEAQEVIDYGLQLHPESTDILIQQAYLYLDTQNLQQAIETANSITDSFEIDVKILKAEIALNQGRLQEANELLSTIEETDFETISSIVYLYIEMGYATELQPWLEKLQKPSDNDEDFMILWADYYFATSQIEKAIEAFNKLIDLDSFNPAYWMGLGKTYLENENFDKAIEACDFAIAADENFGEAYSCRANCYLNIDNVKAAVRDIEKTVELKVLNKKYGFMLIGVLCVENKEWEIANQYFNKLLDYLIEAQDTDPKELIDAYESLAMCTLNMNDLKSAQLWCNKIKEIDPENKEIYLIEGQAQLKDKKYDLAKASFETLLKKSPTADNWYEVGCIYTEEHMIEDAKNAFQKSYELDPNDENTLTKLSLVFLILKDVENFRKYNAKQKEPINDDVVNKILDSLEDKNYNNTIDKLMGDYI